MATLSQNITQAISDFNDIKTAIQNKGVTIASGTPTSDYADLIGDIPTGDDTLFNGIISRTATAITIPDAIYLVGKYAFYKYNTLTSVTFPTHGCNIKEAAFMESGITSVTVYAGGNIDKNAFYNCASLTSADIRCQTIGQQAFCRCPLTALTLTGTRSITAGAFNTCTQLTEVTLPSTLEYLLGQAFADCTALHTINIPSSITTLENYVFRGCSNLLNVTIASGFNANNLNLSPSTLYSHDTILSWFNALADRTGETAYTLYIGTTNKNKMTAEEIAIATNKNWNIA